MTHANKNFATITHGDYLIENNAWRDPEVIQPPQCIFGPPGNLMGWQWQWPGSDSSKVLAFPEIIYGKKPFLDVNSCSHLPRIIEELNRAEVRYQTRTAGSGVFNSVFEMWITHSECAAQDSIVCEVMIWVSNLGLTPAGKRVHSFTTPYGPAHLYDLDNHYLAFVLEQEMLSGTIDLLLFLRELQALKLLAGNQYLASIEFGNEIAYGQGITIIDDYVATVG